MIDEWFNDALRETGHRPLSDFYTVKSGWSSPEGIIEALRSKWGAAYVVERYVKNSYVTAWEESTSVMSAISGDDFWTWTSFHDRNRLFFVFRDPDAAIRFELTW